MVDLHAHLLPGLDDGPQTLAQTMTLLRQARADGTTTIFAAAHVNDGKFQVDSTRYLATLHHVQELLGDTGVRIEPASEMLLGPKLAEEFAAGRYLGMGRTGYACVELPLRDFPPYTFDVLFNLTLEGTRVLLIHPERNDALQRDLSLAQKLREMEIVGVAAVESLLGQAGSEARQAAWDLIELGLIQTMASNAHDTARRPARISPVMPLLAQRFGDHAAELMRVAIPRSIAHGFPVEMRSHPRRRWKLFG